MKNGNSKFKIFVIAITVCVLIVSGYVGLMKIGEKKLKQQIEKLLLSQPIDIGIVDGKIIVDEGWVSWEEAQNKIIKLNGKATPILIEIFETSVDNWQRSTIIQLLGNIGDDKAVDFLISILQTQSEEYATFKTNAIYALGQTNNPKAIEILILALQNKDYQIREASIFALTSIKPIDATKTIPALEKFINIETDNGLQELAQKALKSLKQKSK